MRLFFSVIVFLISDKVMEDVQDLLRDLREERSVENLHDLNRSQEEARRRPFSTRHKSQSSRLPIEPFQPSAYSHEWQSPHYPGEARLRHCREGSFGDHGSQVQSI